MSNILRTRARTTRKNDDPQAVFSFFGIARCDKIAFVGCHSAWRQHLIVPIITHLFLCNVNDINIYLSLRNLLFFFFIDASNLCYEIKQKLNLFVHNRLIILKQTIVFIQQLLPVGIALEHDELSAPSLVYSP